MCDYQLMDAYGRDMHCNPSCNGECRCFGVEGCRGCGDPSNGTIIGFGPSGALDPSLDYSTENEVDPPRNGCDAGGDDGGLDGGGGDGVDGCDQEDVAAFSDACKASFKELAKMSNPSRNDACNVIKTKNGGACLTFWSTPTGISTGDCDVTEAFPNLNEENKARLSLMRTVIPTCGMPTTTTTRPVTTTTTSIASSTTTEPAATPSPSPSPPPSSTTNPGGVVGAAPPPPSSGAPLPVAGLAASLSPLLWAWHG